MRLPPFLISILIGTVIFPASLLGQSEIYKIRINNLLTNKNPCDSDVLSPAGYQGFQNALATVLRSPVIEAIGLEVRKITGENPILAETDINLVNHEEFRVQFIEDIDELVELNREAALAEADDIFMKFGAYAYLTDKFRNDHQRTRISFLCTPDLEYRLEENTKVGQYKLYRLIVHELTRSEMYSMLSLGSKYQELPYQSSGEAFDNEELRLFNILLDWLEDTGQLNELEPLQVEAEVKKPSSAIKNRSASGTFFYDVVSDSWYEDIVYQLAEMKIMSGYKNGRGEPSGFFGPYDQTTRGELIKVCLTARNITPPRSTKSYFTDISPSYFGYDHINYAVEQGWINGYDPEHFGPDDPVTRGQAAKILSNCFNIRPFYSKPPSFTDVPLDHPFYPYIEALRIRKFVSGYLDDGYHPDSPITRAEIAALILKILTAVPKPR